MKEIGGNFLLILGIIILAVVFRDSLPTEQSGGWATVLDPVCWQSSYDRPYYCDEARAMHDAYGERMGW